MAMVHRLARFVCDASFDDLTESTIRQLKLRILDALGCALGAVGADPVRRVRRHVLELGGNGECTLVGGGETAPDRAALYNGFLVRYLDFNDSYLASGETCHPSDNLAPVLAAAQAAQADGRTLLTALAVAYQVHCRLSDEAPVRRRGFDHTTQGSYAASAGVCRALQLDDEQTANAIAIAGTALNALRVTRTGALSHWKGLAYPHTAFGATHAAWLARRGITGPEEVFEGNKGFMDSIAGRFELEWRDEGLDGVERTVIKKYDAEVHSQSAIEGVLELRERYDIDPRTIESIDVDIFDVAHDIIGGGEEGDKTAVSTREEADHSLHYLLAVALIDGEVTPAQYEPARIRAEDVQTLLRRVSVSANPDLSAQFPQWMPCRIGVTFQDGTERHVEKRDYEGFHTRPMGWQAVVDKFNGLAEGAAGAEVRRRIVEVVGDLERRSVRDLVAALEEVDIPRR